MLIQLQPVHVDDLARAIVLAVERDGLAALAVDLGGDDILTFDALLDILARREGKPGAHILHIPWRAMGLVVSATDLLGGHGPITREELGMLRRGNHGDNAPFVAHFGFTPRPFMADAADA